MVSKHYGLSSALGTGAALKQVRPTQISADKCAHLANLILNLCCIKSIRYLYHSLGGMLLCMALVGWSRLVQTQTRTLTGRTTHTADRKLLPVVKVLLKGTGEIFDADGNFHLSVPTGGGGALVFSSVAFQATEISIGNSNVPNVTHQAETRSLNEVVMG